MEENPMKKTRILLTCILVVTLMLSAVIFSSCDMISGIFGNNDVEDGGGNNDVIPDTPDDKPGDSENPDEKPDGPDNTDPTDVPVLSELPATFYNPDNWVYMTNDNGATLDGGDIPYAMNDGSIKFHKVNQAIEIGDFTNSTVSFMLKGTNDWSIWFNSSSIDNANNSSYRLAYAYGGVRIALSSAPEQAAAVVAEGLYKKGEWNRFDISFSTNKDGVCEIKLYINGTRATLSAGDNTTPMVSVANNTLTHTQPAMFTTGNYMVVKVWEAHNYVQIKPVAKAEEKDLPIIACIGAAITEGAGADNFYTESYPAQLQNALNGAYNVINYGNSGKTVRPGLADKESWLDNYQWVGVQAIVPDIAILNIGTNDSKTHHNPTYDGFYDDYKNLVELLLKVNPDMRIIVCTVPCAYSDIWGISNENIKNIIAPVQRAIAAEYEFELVDLFEICQGKASLFPDGVHPSTRGYGMFVKIFQKVLLEGGAALTDEFIDAIHEEYGYEETKTVSDVKSVISGKTLTVSGKTNDTSIRLYIGENESDSTKYNFYADITVAEDGSFSIDFDLGSMPIGGWYNIKLCLSNGVSPYVSLNSLTDGEGNAIGLWTYIPIETTQVQICSWDASGIPTLSFAVSAYTPPAFEAAVTGGSIVAENDQILLTVSGTTNDPNAVLVVGVTDDVELYGHALTIENGSFTVTLDLNTLEADGGWFNIHVIMSDGNKVAVPYDVIGVNVGDVFYSSARKITIKNWRAADKLTSLEVTSPYILKSGQPTSTTSPFYMTEDDGKIYFNFQDELVLDATVERTIEFIFTLADPAYRPESVDNIIYTAQNSYEGESNTAVNFKVNLTDNVGNHGGEWIRFVIKVTEGDTVSYYTIKPSVPAHTGDWYQHGDAFTLDGNKYEIAVQWSSIYLKINNA